MKTFFQLRDELAEAVVNEISARAKKNYLNKATGARDDDDYGDAQSVANLARAKSYKQKDRLSTSAQVVPDGGKQGNKDIKKQLAKRRAGIKRAAGDKEGQKLYKRAYKAGQASGHAATKSDQGGAGETHIDALQKRMAKIHKKIEK